FMPRPPSSSDLEKEIGDEPTSGTGLKVPDVLQAAPRPAPVTQPLPQRRSGNSPSVGPRRSPPPARPSAELTAHPAVTAPDGVPAVARPSAPQGRALAPRFFPPQPRALHETGLSQSMVEELILKALFYAGEMRGGDIANRVKLPTVIVDDAIEGLRK